MIRMIAAAAAALLVMLAALPADAAPKRRAAYAGNSPNVSYMAGPHTRIFVSKRSWLDAGTEVLPGERHYLDYAIPPNHVTGQTMIGPSAPAGWQNPWYPGLGPFEAPYANRWGW